MVFTRASHIAVALVGSKTTAAVETIATEALRRVFGASPEHVIALAEGNACLVGHGSTIAVVGTLKRTSASIAIHKLVGDAQCGHNRHSRVAAVVLPVARQIGSDERLSLFERR